MVSALHIDGLPALPSGPGGTLDVRAIDMMQSPCWVFDPYGHRMLHANPPAIRLWGAPNLRAFLERDVVSGASDAVRVRTASAAAKLAAGAVLHEQITLYPQGKPVTVEALLSGVRTPDGGMAMLIEAREVSVSMDEVRALEALRHVPTLVSLYRGDGGLLFRNPAAMAAYPQDRLGFAAQFADAAAAQAFWDRAWGDVSATAEMLALTSAGPRWHRVQARRTTDPATGQLSLLVNEQDVDDERAVRAEIEHRANHDPLTSLANRSLFRRRLEDAARDADRLGSPFTLLLVDLDRFKAVNDTLGHEAGDALLQAAAQRMCGLVQGAGTLARLGGDEFGAVLPGLGCRGKAAGLAAALIHRVSQDYDLTGHRVSVGASVGVAMHSGTREQAGTVEADEIVRAADRALYGAKSAGRSTFRMAA